MRHCVNDIGFIYVVRCNLLVSCAHACINRREITLFSMDTRIVDITRRSWDLLHAE